jgi:hypothetical protein
MSVRAEQTGLAVAGGLFALGTVAVGLSPTAALWVGPDRQRERTMTLSCINSWDPAYVAAILPVHCDEIPSGGIISTPRLHSVKPEHFDVPLWWLEDRAETANATPENRDNIQLYGGLALMAIGSLLGSAKLHHYFRSRRVNLL